MRNRRLITSLLGSAVCLTGLVGCNTVPREDYDAAVAESAQRSELASPRERLASASSRNSLEQDLLPQSEVERQLPTAQPVSRASRGRRSPRAQTWSSVSRVMCCSIQARSISRTAPARRSIRSPAC